MEKAIQPEKKWNTNKIANQTGKIAIITGGTGGVGFADAKALASKGAKVILLGRNPQKGKEAVSKINQMYKDAEVSFYSVDLGNLAEVKSFGKKMCQQLDRLDILINNAGVMMPKQRTLTSDGFELQFGTNYLAHFALTSELLPLLKKTKGARVVTLGTLPGNFSIDFENLQAEKSYSAWTAYNQSKLAEIIFALHLQRLSEQNNWGISSMGAQPGLVATGLVTKEAGSDTTLMAIGRVIFKIFPFVRQTADKGALSTLYAATDPHAKGGVLYGPNGMGEVSGYPRLGKINKEAKDLKIAQRLWDISLNLAKVKY